MVRFAFDFFNAEKITDMNSTAKLYNYSFTSVKTYLFATIFIAGNIIFPQLAHFIPNGGFIFLPIYFFTLIAAYKYGLKVGLLTAIMSPVINHLLFGMPPVTVLPIILTKSILLAVTTAYFAKRANSVKLLSIIWAVLFYQFAGTVVEWIAVKNFFVAVQDIRIGMPGILLQVFGGYLLLKSIENH